jgi:basic membrane protein A and related proteins
MGMRRVLPLGLVLVLAACGGGGGGGGGTQTETNGAGAGTTQAAAIKACLISDVGRFNDKGFNQLQLQGLNAAGKRLGIQTKAIESHAAGDYVPNLSTCARSGFDITISAGFLLADPTSTVAKQFPNQHFAITDYDVTGAPFNGQKNVEGLTYATQENGYLVGCMAALMTKNQGGKQVIGAVGGVKIPSVDTYIAGYQAGAERCVPGTKVLVGYSQDFVDQAKCSTIAGNQIDAGSQVEFNVAGGCGLGTLSTAKSRGVGGIGVAADQSYLGPHILTSAVKRVDQGVFLAIKDVQNGTFVGGRNLVFDLKNGGVGLGKTSKKVPQAVLAKVNTLKAQIIAGTITPPSTVKSS